MDVFAVHALAGAIGTFMTGLFAQASVAANDGYAVVEGGWLDRNFAQLYKQIAWIAVGTAWTFVVTYIIMFLINLVPGLHFRADDEAQVVGMDEVEHDEFVADYAWFHRDIEDSWHARAVMAQNQRGSEEEKSSTGPGSGAVTTGVHPVPDEEERRGRPVDPKEMQKRGRGEGGVHEDDMEMAELDQAEEQRTRR
jgi:Amt family ammonium transporter